MFGWHKRRTKKKKENYSAQMSILKRVEAILGFSFLASIRFLSFFAIWI
jgi:hypothetical protein